MSKTKKHRRSTSSNTTSFPVFNLIATEPYLYPYYGKVILPQLQGNQKELFKLIKSGNTENVKQFLESNENLNVNITNVYGLTPLVVAIQIHSLPIIELLLNHPNIEIGDAVLYAIYENQLEIMEVLLEKQKKISPSLEFVGATHSTQFADYITPLMLAAQMGHYEIITRLIERGHIISKPHSPRCRCRACRLMYEKEDLLHAENLRLDLYRAVCNPEYLCHSTNDPILTSFVLSAELKDCSILVPEFRSAYLELSEQISGFAVDLVANCRDTIEVELVLSQKSGLYSFGLKYNVPRLVLAIDYKQKMFVAHPHVQHFIQKTWYGGWYNYPLNPIFLKILWPIFRLLIMPIICIMTIFMHNHRKVLFWSTPLNKMINHCATYIFFLILIFIESNMSKVKQKRLPPNSGCEPLIIIFVIGYVWSIIRMCLLQGPYRFFKHLWNWHAILTNFLFILTFIFWSVSYLDAQKNDRIHLERKYWNAFDPLLLAEGTFAVATTLSYFKLIYYCKLNYYLGPLQISLGKMCSDMAKYVTIFCIIILAFSVGLCTLYQAYDGMVQIDSAGIKTAQISSFTDLKSTLKTFFWAILCMSPLESADVIIENLQGETWNSTKINNHIFTEAIGYIAFALFEIITVVMILNMLIATMSSTFQRVIDNIDIEWVFGKTDLYLEYMLQTTLPPPLNLIPTPTGINLVLEWLTTTTLFDSEKEYDKGNAYPALMTQLVQRYFRQRNKMITVYNEIEQSKKR